MFVEIRPSCFVNLNKVSILQVEWHRPRIGAPKYYSIFFGCEETEERDNWERLQLGRSQRVGEALIVELMKRVEEGKRVLFHKEYNLILEELIAVLGDSNDEDENDEDDNE